MNPVLANCGLALGLLIFTTPSARAATDCDALPESWQPRSAVSALAQRNGWQIDRLKIDDGCYEIMGRDADGRRFKAKVHPASLQVISMKHGRHERERAREGPRGPASAPASVPSSASEPRHGSATPAGTQARMTNLSVSPIASTPGDPS